STTAGYRTLFGDLPLQKNPNGEITIPILSSNRERGPQGAGGYGNVVRTEDCHVEVVSTQPQQDAERLLRAFIGRAYRRPAAEGDVQRSLAVVKNEMNSGHAFTYSMLAGYTAIICSPPFLYLEEEPGRLDSFALASRLSFFLWNSPPDDALLARARSG